MADIVANDPDPLPGKAESWASGEPPVGNADAASTALGVRSSSSDAQGAFGMNDPGLRAMTDKMAQIDREKIGTADKAIEKMDSEATRYKGIAENQLSASVKTADSLTKWDADYESAKRRTDPIAAFGSLGSVFGILASAFTHAPMENALNASAAAMTAIKQGDDKAYDRAYKAWQDNEALAVKRATLQHNAYQDAISLMTTNAAMAKDKLKLEFLRFDDKKNLLLHEAGYDEEMFKNIAAQETAKTKMAEGFEARLLANQQMAEIIQDPRFKLPPGDPRRGEMIQEAQLRWKQSKTAAEEYIRQFEIERKQKGEDFNSDKFAEGYNKMMRLGSLSGADTGELKRRTEFYESPEGGSLSPTEAFDKARAEISKASTKPGATGGNTDLTEGRQRAKAVADFRDRLVVEKNPDGTAKYNPDQVADMTERRREQLKTYGTVSKAFSSQDSSRLAYTPSLVRSLQVLDELMDDSTGMFTGVLKKYAGEYLGVNTPVQLWQAAEAEAGAALTSLAPVGSRSVLALREQLDTLPSTPRSSSYGHQQMAVKIRDLLDESQTSLSTMEASGKKIPEDVLDKFAKFGVTTKTNANKNPIEKLAKDPSSLTDEEMKNMVRLRAGLPKETQEKINAESRRRYDAWERANPPSAPSAP